jgi:hypothetical protein
LIGVRRRGGGFAGADRLALLATFAPDGGVTDLLVGTSGATVTCTNGTSGYFGSFRTRTGLGSETVVAVEDALDVWEPSPWWVSSGTIRLKSAWDA